MKKILLSISFIIIGLASSLGAMRDVVLKSEITTLEPMKGIVFWPDQAVAQERLQSSISLEYSYCLPCKVVTGKTDGKIQYDWSSFETMLNDIASRGHQAIVRFRYEYPGTDGEISGTEYCTCNVAGATAVPLYIKKLSDYNETYSKNPGGDGETFYADWSNAELQWFTKQFYTDFAVKYDNDPRIAFIQVGFGHWSEYHIYGTDLQLGRNFPDHKYQKEFLIHINNTFKETPWSISIDAADDSYTPIVNDPELMALNFGRFDDSFMHSEHEHTQGEGYNEDCWKNLGANRWQISPCGGEISYYTNTDQKEFLNPAGMHGFTWEQAAAKYHMTYVIGNDAPEGKYATPERVLEAGQNSGYKFQITKYQVSNSEAVVIVKNIGIAPIYHNAYVTVNGVRSATSLKGLLPEQALECHVTGLTISDNEAPALTITSNKLLEGITIPYEANLDGTGLSAPTCKLSTSSKAVKPNNSVTLTATASSDNGTISSVVIKLGTNTIATLTTAPYTYEFTPTSEGTYSFTATATDAKNLVAESSVVTITCSTGPTEDFETLTDKYPATSGDQLKIGASGTGLCVINGLTWEYVNARADDKTKHSTINYPASSTMSLSFGTSLTTPEITVGNVSFMMAAGKDNKIIGYEIYTSADNYMSPIKVGSFNNSADFVTIELALTAPGKLKIVNTNTSGATSTDCHLIVDNFNFKPESQSTEVNEAIITVYGKTYNLQGQEVEENYKGIVTRNGKTYLQK